MTIGTLGLVGGAEWNSKCTFDAYLLEKSKSDVVTLLPTAAAYEKPQSSVDFATKWFRSLGARVDPVMVLTRSDADDAMFASQIEKASFIYIGGGSPMHLFSVLKDSLCYQAMQVAFRNGATLAGSSAGAMVLGDPMVDPRGGGLTLGLGIVKELAILPHYSATSPDLKHRTVSLAESDVVIAGIEEQTALIRESDGSWNVAGSGSVHLIQGGVEVTLDHLRNQVELGV